MLKYFNFLCCCFPDNEQHEVENITSYKCTENMELLADTKNNIMNSRSLSHSPNITSIRSNQENLFLKTFELCLKYIFIEYFIDKDEHSDLSSDLVNLLICCKTIKNTFSRVYYFRHSIVASYMEIVLINDCTQVYYQLITV